MVLSALFISAISHIPQALGQTASSDSAKVYALLAYNATLKNDPPAAHRFFKIAEMFARTEGRPELQVYCINGLAEVLLREGKPLAARRILRKLHNSAFRLVPPSSQARTLELRGMVDLRLDHAEAAVKSALEGIRLLEEAGSTDSNETANLHSLCGESLRQGGRYNEAIQSFKTAQEKRPCRDSTSQGAIRTQVYLALCYASQGEHDAAFCLLSKVLRNIVRTGPGLDGLNAIALSVLSFVEGNLGLQEQAVAHQEQSLSLAYRAYSRDDPALADYFCGLSDRSCELEDYESALNYADRAIHILEGNPSSRSTVLGSSYAAKSAALLEIGKPHLALQWLNRSFRVLMQQGRDDNPLLAWMYEVHARALKELGRYEEGLQANQRALTLRRKGALTDGRYDIVHLLAQQGEILTAMGRYSEADTVVSSARAMCERSSTRSLSQLAVLECALATTSLRRGSLREALEHVEKTLNISGYVESPDRTDNAINFPDMRFPDLVLDALSVRASAQLALARTSPDPISYMTMALGSLESAIQLSENERRSFPHESTRIAHGLKRAELYERAVELSLALEHETGDSSFRYQALRLADRRKARALRDELASQERWKMDGAPDSCLRAVASLDRRIASRTIALERGGTSFGIRVNVVRLEDELFRLQARRDSIVRTLPTQSNPLIVDMWEHGPEEWTDAGSRIPRETAILSYFVGRSHCRVFVLTRDTLVVRSLAVPQLIGDQVKAFSEAVNSLPSARFYGTSAALYQSLIRPISSSLAGVTRLVIVPDGFLTKVPFEAIAPKGSSPTIGKGNADFTRVPFLIRSYDIIYAQSAESYLAAETPLDVARLPETASFAGFAPVFADKDTVSPPLSALRSIRHDGKTYDALAYSANEVSDIAGDFRAHGHAASCSIGKDASKERFTREAPSRSIIHISTHGAVNEEKPLLSALLFSPLAGAQSKDDNVLYAGEAAALGLNAELVVLGSCESGRGQLAGSEGMLAMSRSFFQAGAKHLMYSLWPVGDRQTATLMRAFYSVLLDGGTYAGGLRAAKLKLLSDSSTAFPSKWAGFVLVGR